MRRVVWLQLVSICGMAVVMPAIPSAIDGTPPPSLAAVRIARDTGDVHGTAALIQRKDQSNRVVLQFLTSSRLFKTPEGDRMAPARTVVVLDGGHAVDVGREGLYMTTGLLVDVAILRVETTATALLPLDLVYDAPPAGSPFVLFGNDASGRAVTVPAQIRFRTTRFAVGNSDVSRLQGCIGVPALLPEGSVFGVVSECEPQRTPVVSLLAMARAFIERALLAPLQRSVPTAR
jgi:hypothetical protein